MPTEIRHIIFSSAELYVALKEYRRRRDDPLPEGTVLRFDIEPGPEIRADVLIARDDGAPDLRLLVRRDELAAALIMYCIDRKIPMPVKSTKFLQLFGGSLGLVITKNAQSETIGKADREGKGEDPPPA